MLMKSISFGLLTALALGHAATAQDISVQEPYAITTGMTAQTGAAFMVLVNTGTVDDALVDVSSDVARLVELHTHTMNDAGVMSMSKVTEPVPLPAGGEIVMDRGGYHVMFMGLTAPLQDGDMVAVTLVFQNAGEVVVEVPVDLSRLDGEADMGDMDMSSE